MEWVDSSVIKSIGYDNGILSVEFLGGAKYRYYNVPERIYYDFVGAESKGAYFRSCVRGKFQYERVY